MIRAMVKQSLLASNERVIFEAHSHWKNIFVPVLVTVAVTALAVFALVQWVDEDQTWLRWTVVAVATIADRATGAAEKFADAGFEYRHVFGLEDLGLA